MHAAPQHDFPAGQPWPSGQHTASPGIGVPLQHWSPLAIACPLQHSALVPSRHWPPHMLRHGHELMLMVHEPPPPQLQLWPLDALITHEVTLPLLLHDAVRVNVTAPSHADPQLCEPEPGQRIWNDGHDCAAESAATSSNARIARRIAKEDTLRAP